MYSVISFCQTNTDKTEFFVDFEKESFEHIMNISGFGVHTAGSPQEKQVADYTFNELSNMDVETSVESFEFESFDITKTNLRINNQQIEALQVCFNPYLEKFQFQDNFILLNPDNTTTSNIEDKIVVASFPLDNSKYFRLFFGRPKLILVIPSQDFHNISQSREVVCNIKGEIKKHKSQNIVGFIPGKQKHNNEIIISAHYDSYPGSIGADDNASGVAVLIELAKYFKQFQDSLNTNLRFVAFGGEEKGLVGSRAYLNLHKEDIRNCKLLFNMDQLGGERIFIETTGGVQGIPKEQGINQFPQYLRNRSLEGIESNWRLLAPEALPIFAISNRPEWLASIIKESTNELLIPVIYTGNTGSDQMTFAQAGIVASAIGTSGNEVHSPKDIPSQVHKQSIVDCGRIAIKIIIKTSEKYKN